MSRICYARHQFPLTIIQNVVWLYLRFEQSLRDVEELLARRGIRCQLRDSRAVGGEVRYGL